MSKKSHPHKFQKKATRVFFLVAITVSVTFWMFVLYTPMEVAKGQHAVGVNEYEGITDVELRMDLTLGEFDIQYNLIPSDSETLFQANWTHAFSNPDSYHPYNFTITEEIAPDNHTLIIMISDVSTPQTYFGPMSVNALWFDIQLNPNYTHHISGEIGTAEVDVIAEDILFGTIDLDSSTGDSNFYLTNCTVSDEFNLAGSTGDSEIWLHDSSIATGLNFYRTTGDIYLTGTFIEFENITLESNTGDVDIHLYHSVGLNITGIQTTGDFYISLTDSIVAEISTTAGTGDADIFMRESTVNGNIWVDRTTGGAYLSIRESFIHNIFSEGGTGRIRIIMDEAKIENTVDIVRTTGDIDLDFSRIVMNETVGIYVEASTGDIEVEWDNYNGLSHDAVIIAQTSTGDIDMWLRATNAAPGEFIVTASGDTEEPDIDIEYFD